MNQQLPQHDEIPFVHQGQFGLRNGSRFCVPVVLAKPVDVDDELDNASDVPDCDCISAFWDSSAENRLWRRIPMNVHLRNVLVADRMPYCASHSEHSLCQADDIGRILRPLSPLQCLIFSKPITKLRQNVAITTTNVTTAVWGPNCVEPAQC